MPLRKRTRTILKIVLTCLVLLALIWISVPIWFPWVLPEVGRRLGGSYAKYERVGYSHFALHNVIYEEKSVRITAERVEAPVPTRWLTALKFGTQSSEPVVRVWNWQVIVKPAETNVQVPVPVAKSHSTNSELPEVLRTVAKWIPRAYLTNGTVMVSSNVVTAPGLVWSNAALYGSASVNGKGPLEIAARPTGAMSYEAGIDSEPLHLKSSSTVVFKPEQVGVESAIWWWSNRVDAEVTLAKGVSLPVYGSVSATNFNLSSEALKLPYYGEISGSVSAKWLTNAFILDADAKGTPKQGSTNLPPIHLTFHARGDTNEAVVQTASLSSPWLSAELSRELNVHFTGPLLRDPANLKIMADLNAQPWLKVSGRIEGQAEFEPDGGKWPKARFMVTGSKLAYQSFEAESVRTEGAFTWPQLDLSRLEATLGDGSKAIVSGGIDLEKKITREGHLDLEGPLVKRWLPTNYTLGSFHLISEFSGAVSALQHQGRLEVTNLITPQFQPVDVHLRWTGMQTNLQQFELAARARSEALEVKGNLEMRSGGIEIGVSGFELATNGRPALALSAPALVKLDFGKPLEINVSGLNLSGGGRKMAVRGTLSWPNQGAVDLQVENLGSSLLSGFLKAELPSLEINKLDAQVAWTNGPVAGKVALSASGSAPGEKWKQMPLALALEGSTGLEGLVISNLTISSRTSAVVQVNGTVPLSIHPENAALPLEFRTNQALNLTASTGPDAFFWQEMAQLTRLDLRNPRANLRVVGTWEEPSGHINVRIAQIGISGGHTNLPSFTNLELDLALDRNRARLTSGQILVAGQRVSLIGELPLGHEFWERIRHKQSPDWTTATAQLQIDDAELAAFAPLFPNVVAPQGELSADVELKKGGDLEGELQIARARTRPIGITGPLRDVGLNLRLKDRKLELKGGHASIGGATVTLNGQVDLTGNEWLQGQMPPFALSLHGANVPLARQPEYIIRSDLLLGISKTNGAAPLISGTARLHDCYYLSDLNALIPGKVATPSSRPPYFSITDPFLADWRLSLDVQGAPFMKLRSPVFNGEIGSNLKLQGTLKDPIALGDVKIESGLVRFPFASLQVQQGMVTLTSQDPYHPQLLVRAASKQFGYDIRMDVTGPVDAPVIQFNSTPPLSSEQILLMVSAGELPQGNYTLTTQQRAQTVALFLGRDVLNKLGIGDSAEPRLSIKSGEEISDQGRPTYRIEYKLTDRWSLTGEYDRFGDYNAGVKWRVYSK